MKLNRIPVVALDLETVDEELGGNLPCHFEGKIVTRKWTDKQNIERYSTEIIAREMQMLSSSDRNKGTHSAAEAPAKDYPAEGKAEMTTEDIPF